MHISCSPLCIFTAYLGKSGVFSIIYCVIVVGSPILKNIDVLIQESFLVGMKLMGYFSSFILTRSTSYEYSVPFSGNIFSKYRKGFSLRLN